MTKLKQIGRNALGTAVAAALAVGLTVAGPTRAMAQPVAAKPTNDVTLSVGNGRMVRLDGTMSDIFVANDAIADVQVRSANQIYIFGKAAGQTTVFATDRAGKVIYSANVKVGTNLDSIDHLLHLAMPGAQVQATPLSGMILLTGTVGSPADIEEAHRLVQAFVGDETRVISRLRSATPLQVMLQVKIAEVSRSVVRGIGVNLLNQTSTGGFNFGISQGQGIFLPPADNTDPSIVPRVLRSPVGTTLSAAGNLLGMDILSSLELAETQGLVTTLAEPSLTALSGETASFLAGGEFPIPVSQSLGAVTIEYKPYGVGLAFTPVVLEDGRISIRVRPEVSELSTEGSIRLNGYDVPAITTRRAETTVELGSGQSFMIGGLLRNAHTNSTDKAPWLGDVPILGALFRSNRYRRAETELVIVVTPYLVKPVSAHQIALPTDGFRTAPNGNRVFLGQQHDSRSGEARPMPNVGGAHAAPGMGSAALPEVPAIPEPRPQQPLQQAQRQPALPPPAPSTSATPGFNFR